MSQVPYRLRYAARPLGHEHAHVFMYACKHKLMSISVLMLGKSDVNCVYCYNQTVVVGWLVLGLTAL